MSRPLGIFVLSNCLLSEKDNCLLYLIDYQRDYLYAFKLSFEGRILASTSSVSHLNFTIQCFCKLMSYCSHYCHGFNSVMRVGWIWFVTMKLQPGSNRDKWEQKTESLLSLFAFSAYRWIEKLLGSGTPKNLCSIYLCSYWKELLMHLAMCYTYQWS